MVRRYDPGYDASRIQVIPFPRAEDYGHGWWRSTWEIKTTPPELLLGWRLPHPPRELADLALIVAVSSHRPGRITVEALSHSERLGGEEVAYISLVMQEIHASYQELIIDGHKDHPILHMARG